MMRTIKALTTSGALLTWRSDDLDNDTEAWFAGGGPSGALAIAGGTVRVEMADGTSFEHRGEFSVAREQVEALFFTEE